MNVVTRDIKDVLENDSSLGLTFGTNLFIGLEPAMPSTCVTLFDTYGRNELTLDAQNYEYPAIQVRVRAALYDEAMSLAIQINNFLHGQHQQIINGTYYGLIENVGGPALLDFDNKNRVRVIMNFNLQRR